MARNSDVWIRGRLIGAGMNHTFANTTVSARVDKRLLARGFAGPEGAFALKLPSSAVALVRSHPRARVYFTVAMAGVEVVNTRTSVNWHPKSRKKQVIIAVPEPVSSSFPSGSPRPPLFVAIPISGRVTDSGAEPLLGYPVRAIDTKSGVTLAQSSVGSNGAFTLTLWVPHSQEQGTALVEVQVLSPGDAETVIAAADAPLTNELPLELKVSPPVYVAPSLPLVDLAKTVGMKLSRSLSATLSELGILSLADIRSRGGLDITVPQTDQPMAQRLVAHASLSALSADFKLNDSLISLGFCSPLRIARATPTQFTAKAKGVLEDAAAVALHTRARAQVSFLNQALTGAAAEVAMGMTPSLSVSGTGVHERMCGCDDCAAAVSPAAYLADLLHYSVTHLQDGASTSVRLLDLKNRLFQPFDDLLTSCEAVKQPVRQVRLCVEVLRRLLAQTSTPVSTDYAQNAYEALLQSIGTSSAEIRLARSDSPEDRAALAQRLGFTLSPPIPSAARSDELDALYLDPSSTLTEEALEILFGLVDTTRDPLSDGIATGDPPPQLAHWSLEGVQWRTNTDNDGLVHLDLSKATDGSIHVDAYRDAGQLVSSGAKDAAFDKPFVLSAANGSGLDGQFTLRYSTDADEIAWRALPRLVAWRSRNARKAWALADRPSNPYSDLPDGFDVRDRLPIIDPDVIGPDDFRLPVQKVNATDPDGLFDLWVARRRWVDTQLGALGSLTNLSASPSVLEPLLEAMQKPITYGTTTVTPWPATPAPYDLDALEAQLADPKSVEEATRVLRYDLHLSQDAFMQLLAVRAKDRIAQPISTDELDTVVSILVQAQKAAVYATWEQEEDNQLASLLGPRSFVVPARPPRAGTWPPIPDPWAPAPPPTPWVDPETSIQNLPEAVAGRRALALHRMRTVELQAVRDGIRAAHEANPTDAFTAILQQALGTPPVPEPSWSSFLLSLQNAILDGTNTAAVEQGLAELHLTQDEFSRLMAVKARYDDTSPKRAPPSPSEWGEIYALLTTAEKVARKYPAWIAEENAIALQYWEAAKAALPAWRLPEGGRQAWSSALATRSSPPIIDPDLLLEAHFRDQRAASPPYGILQSRAAELLAIESSLAATRSSATSQLDAFMAMLLDALLDPSGDRLLFEATRARLAADRLSQGIDFELEQVLGSPLPDLAALSAQLGDPTQAAAAKRFIRQSLFLTVPQFQQVLAARSAATPTPADLAAVDDALSRAALLGSIMGLAAAADAGEDIRPRLAQLALTSEAFGFLTRTWKLAGEDLVGAAEWQDVADILVNARKQLLYAVWRDDEKNPSNDIVLAPEYFQLVPPDPTAFPPPAPAPPERWRGTLRDRRQWEATLVARSDELQAIAAGVASAVDDVEQAKLPRLRDRLIAAAATNADDVTDHLLIDASMDGCASTTRVGQAIETIQGLLFGVRSGQLPELGWSLSAPDFDDEWQWLGSYAPWRAAMFVFLYPENILLPTLRRHQTPVFRQLVNDLRNQARVTPEDACEAGKTYSTYLQDVFGLTIDASCQAMARVGISPRCKDRSPLERRIVQFLFGHGPSGRIYWSSFDPGDGADYAQSFWTEVTGFSGRVVSVLGAVPYTTSSNTPYLFVFAVTDNAGKLKISYLKLDLMTYHWDEQAVDLDLPDKAVNWKAVLKQVASDDQPPHVAIRMGDGSIVDRQLNVDGTGWEDVDFRTVIDAEWGAKYVDLLGMVQFESHSYYLFVQTRDGHIAYKLFQLYDVPVYRLKTRSPESYYYTTDLEVRDDRVKNKGYVSEGLKFHVGVSAQPGTDLLLRFFNDTRPLCALALRADSGAVALFRQINGVSADGALGYTHTAAPRGAYQLGVGAPNNSTLYYTAVAAELDSSTFNRCGYVTDDKWLTLGIQLPDAPDGTHQVLEDGSTWMGAICWRVGADPFVFLDHGGVVTAVRVGLRGDVDPTKGNVSSASVGSLFNDSKQPILHSGPPQFTYEHPRPKLPGHTDPSVVITAVHYVAYSRDTRNSWPGARILPLARGASLVLHTYPDVQAAPTDHIVVSAPGIQLPGLTEITDRLSDRERVGRSYQTRALLPVNTTPRSNSVYIQEAYYYLPVHLALQLESCGEYLAALDWLRTVWDYAPLDGNPRVYYGFAQANSPGLLPTFARPDNWLSDPLNPHAIAEVRPHTDERFTLLTLLRCLLDFADSEFTRDTSESVPRARMLYLTAQRLLQDPVLAQSSASCSDVIGEIDVALEPLRSVPSSSAAILKHILTDVDDPTTLREAVDSIKYALAAKGPVRGRVTVARTIAEGARSRRSPSPTLGAIVETRDETIERAHLKLATDTGLYQILQHLNDSPPMEIASDALLSGSFPFAFCVPRNPILDALRLHVTLDLYKIRTCRNIAGLQRELDPYAAPTDTKTGLPSIAGGTLTLPLLNAFAPTPYRYATLIERARQLVQLAAQAESSLLATLEKRDAEQYSLSRARQDVRMAQAQVQLQNLRVRETQDSVQLAELQRDRAEIQSDYYQELLETPISALEATALSFMAAAAVLEVSAAGGFFTKSDVGGALSALASASSTAANIVTALASYERRQREWQFQKQLADQDVRIGAQQVTIAQDNVRIAGQELVIANLQYDNASSTVDYLSTKFTNVELYDWMGKVLGSVYGFLLRQATSVARTAQNQLAFERQQIPSVAIADDYWTAPSDQLTASPEAQAPDRKGLTGSARLLADVVRLDEYALETNQRKLQLSRTVSLASSSPVEFARFRQSGVLPFTTTLEDFDREFPGHYLRLIRRVRTSVVALVPASIGIRATLSMTGSSRVVVGPAPFQEQLLVRPPQSVSLVSPRDATGLFELDPQSDLLLPFEGSGVAASWEFRMPAAANPVDFGSIADVLATIDYTALDSFDYRQQVVAELAPYRSADRAYSFRNDLPDAWYALNNPDQSDTPMTVTFRTERDDFPPNLQKITVGQVTLFFATSDAPAAEFTIGELTFLDDGGNAPVGGGAVTINGAVSTRSGNGGAWMPISGKTPAGGWKLRLPNTAALKARFAQGEVTDILLVITYSGLAPDWPV